jgi:hypothetical protein
MSRIHLISGQCRPLLSLSWALLLLLGRIPVAFAEAVLKDTAVPEQGKNDGCHDTSFCDGCHDPSNKFVMDAKILQTMTSMLDFGTIIRGCVKSRADPLDAILIRAQQ